MTIDDYLRKLPHSGTRNLVPGMPVSGVSNDSRSVGKGDLFCAVKGAKLDGSRFIPAALGKGACAVVAESPENVPENVPLILVKDSFAAWAALCEIRFGFPAEIILMHAVTGTNGKTTSAYMMRELFRTAFPLEKCGLISTVEIDTGDGAPVLSEHTTPDALSFQKIMSEMRKNGCPRAVMETSSHGLHQHRTGSVRFKTAIFTNLTGDHLDYHHDMESYFRAKRILFDELCSGSKIVNVDDPYGKRLASDTGGDVLPLSLEDPHAGCFAEITHADAHGTEFLLKMDGLSLRIAMHLVGRHNVYNACGAAAAALRSGASPESVIRAFAEFKAVPGRLEHFILKNGASAYVDYAHTDDALARVLSALRPLCRGRLICVYGCGGDRDRTKRPRMGRVVSQMADFGIVTNDNPRSEEPSAIAAEIVAGIVPGAKYEIELDREKAVALAVSLAGPDDLILVAGKGHENTQEIKGVKHHLDDRETIRRFAADSGDPLRS